MSSPKVIIHRLDAPWLRDSRRQCRSLHRALIAAAAVITGFVSLTGVLRVAADPDITPPAPSVRPALTRN